MTGESLIYKIIVNPRGEFFPSEPIEPKRGSLAFQTDLLVKKGRLPLVVVETKHGRFSTHDVLTYSAKAVKHKEVYPCLRYGVVVGEVNIISNKFFTHNVGFDFALAIKDVKKLTSFLRLVKIQIGNAEILLKNLNEKNKTKCFQQFLR